MRTTFASISEMTKIKKFMLKKRDELFPEILKDEWTFHITENMDKSFQVTLRHIDTKDYNKSIDFIQFKNKIICCKLDKISSFATKLNKKIKEWKIN